MKVKCINNSNGVLILGAKGLLTIDKVYEVIEVASSGCYRILNDGGLEYAYLPHRFVIVEDDVPCIVPSKECPCGIVRSMCDYHKAAT